MGRSSRYETEEVRIRNTNPLHEECYDCDEFSRLRVTKYGYICFPCEMKHTAAEYKQEAMVKN